MVTVPVGLWYECYAESCCFEHTADDGGAGLGMVDIGVTGKEYDVEFVPAAEGEFFFGCRYVVF